MDDLVALAQIADLLVLTGVAFKGVEGEILGEIRDGDILQHLVVDLVVGAQLVGLGHLQVVVGDLHAAVVRDIIHLDVGVDGTRGDDVVVVVFGSRIVALGIGVLEEVLVAAVGVLGLVAVALILGKLEPVGHGHGAEVGERPEIAGTVHGTDTAGLGGTQRQVVVGPEELDGGELLEGHVSPVLVEVQNRQLGLLTRFEGEREVGFGVGGIAGVEDRLLVLALEVLVDHDGNGQEHIVLVQKNGVLAAAARGVGVDVDVAVIGGIHRNGGGVVAVPLVEEGLVEACAADGEFVSAAQSVIARVAVAAEGLQRMALDLGLL